MKDLFSFIRAKAYLKFLFSIGAKAAAEGGIAGLSRITSWNNKKIAVKRTAWNLRRLFKFVIVSSFESAKKKLVSKKASAVPKGMPSVITEVAKARSLSENHFVATMLTELMIKGAAHAYIVVPTTIGQN